MTFSQAIKQIRDLSRDDITSIVSEYVKLKRSGNSMKGCCPFHEEKTPSFHVSDQKGIYKCFGCGLGGDAIDFVMRMDGKEFHEVIYQFADRYHITIEKGTDGSNRPTKPKLDPIPELKTVRSEIRKAGSVTIVCNGSSLEEFDTKAIVRITPPLTNEQAESLKKCTDNCELILDQALWPDVQSSINSALKNQFSITVLNDGNSMDWLHYVIRVHEPNRKEIIELLAAIPDGITRSIYMTEYSGMVSQVAEVDQCT